MSRFRFPFSFPWCSVERMTFRWHSCCFDRCTDRRRGVPRPRVGNPCYVIYEIRTLQASHRHAPPFSRPWLVRPIRGGSFGGQIPRVPRHRLRLPPLHPWQAASAPWGP